MKEVIHIRIEKELKEKLLELAQSLGHNPSSFVRHLIYLITR